ncbi:hypothetical protein EDC04DRAFT_2611517 [Pisolithus marmoratus]|nr:hypothetical protein EDC04DRAFT_2611517 [Pisolithus marmoratus]
MLEKDWSRTLRKTWGRVGFHKLPKGVNREASVGDHESKGYLSEEVWSVVKLESETWTRTKSASSHTSWKRKSLGETELKWKKQKVVSALGWASEVAMKAGLGEDNQTMEYWVKPGLQKSRSQKGQQVRVEVRVLKSESVKSQDYQDKDEKQAGIPWAKARTSTTPIPIDQWIT